MIGEKSADKPQIDRFREAARELGADESEERFRDAVKKLATAPPTPKGAQPKKAKPVKE